MALGSSAQIVDVDDEMLTVQCAGTEQKIDSLIRLLDRFGVLGGVVSRAVMSDEPRRIVTATA